MKLFDNTFNAIEKSLDMSLRRHTVLTSNIANNETPNYQARDVNFANVIKNTLDLKNDELVKTNKMHLDIDSSNGAHIYIDKSMPVGADGNNVDLDIQMGKISANSRQYSQGLNLLTVKLRMLKAAAMGRAGGF